jgi:hypothetical protein
LGDNGLGKSSFIQFIQIALGSKNIPDKTNGEGVVWVDKEGKEYIFKLSISEGKATIIVECDGMRDNRKSTIASIVGAIDFDIDEFVKLSETAAGRKRQVEIVKSFLPQEIKDEIAKIEKKIELHYTDRHELGKKVKLLEGAIKSDASIERVEPVNIDNLSKRLSEANTQNKLIQSRISNAEAIEVSLSEKENQLISVLEKAKSIQEEIASMKKQLEIAQNWLSENKEIEIAPIQEELINSSKINEKARVYKEYQEKVKELEDSRNKYGELTALIDTCRQLLTDTIRDMDSPVKGLSFDAEQLLYNGIPVSINSLSTSEIIELGIRLKMAENNDMGILFIQRGESIGKERLSLINKIAEENGWQIIMEQVERGTDKLRIEITNNLE